MIVQNRAYDRQDCFLRAEILLNGGANKLACEAQDISDGGLKLTGANFNEVPDSFLLAIPRRSITERVSVKRRGDDSIGVEFETFRF